MSIILNMENYLKIFKFYHPFYFLCPPFQSQLFNKVIKNIPEISTDQLMSKHELNQLKQQISFINDRILKNAQSITHGTERPDIKASNGKKLLFLDLDLTLIYYDEDNHVHIRPNLMKFLKEVELIFNIYIFTAADQQYVEMILTYLQEEQKYLKGILTRKNCTMIVDKGKNVGAIKNLKIISSCSLKNMILVDDNPFSYLENLSNAIPIKPYEGGKDDGELLKLQKVLEELAHCDDVREQIAKNFFGKLNQN